MRQLMKVIYDNKTIKILIGRGENANNIICALASDAKHK